MKKAVWLTGIFVVVFMLVIGCYLFFFQEKSSKVPEGTFVRKETSGITCNRMQREGAWDAWQRNA